MWIAKLANNEIVKQDRCKWEHLPITVPIKTFSYLLPNKKELVLNGFDRYLFIIDRYNIVSGGKGNWIHSIHILGKYKTRTYQLSLNLRKGIIVQRRGFWDKNEFASLNWDPTIKKFIFGKGQKTNKDLWKFGVIGAPKVEII